MLGVASRNARSPRPLLVLAGVLAALFAVLGVIGYVSRPSAHGQPLATVRVADLPPQAQQTLLLIKAGGPFPYAEDGTVFTNREGLLPGRPSGYYREYTVVTPGSADRGARRIVAGGGVAYYTDDHYASFREVVP
jgi:ribonuclease T1